MSGKDKDKKLQGESKTPAPPVEQKAPVEKENAEEKATCLDMFSLEQITETLGTMEEATVAFKVAEKRKNAAAELASEAEELAKAEEGKVRSAEAKATYSKAQAEILKNERVVAEEKLLKEQRETEEAEKAEAEEVKRLAAEEEVKIEAEKAAKVRRDSGEYELLIGEQVGKVFISRSALDLGAAGVILRLVYLDGPGGKVLGLPEHLHIPMVKPVNGILRRSKT